MDEPPFGDVKLKYFLAGGAGAVGLVSRTCAAEGAEEVVERLLMDEVVGGAVSRVMKGRKLSANTVDKLSEYILIIMIKANYRNSRYKSDYLNTVSSALTLRYIIVIYVLYITV